MLPPEENNNDKNVVTNDQPAEADRNNQRQQNFQTGPIPPELTSKWAHHIAKRNSGKTGPTSEQGKAISSQNALRHGCCAKTLILDEENLADWIKLCARWEASYPSDQPLLQDFILKTAQADWHRIRVTDAFNAMYGPYDIFALDSFDADMRKMYDLKHRYKVAAERSFQREYRMLEHFYNTHCVPKKKKPEEPKKEEEKEEDDKPVYDPNKHNIRVYNAVTGEYIICGEEPEVVHPPDPGWVPRKIIPGQFYPDHPSNWKYPGDPKERFRKDKKKWSKQ